MTDTTSSPNMGMPVPNVGAAPGPDWATDVNASLSVVDSHDHSSGKGVPITPNGLNINADLTFGGNNAYAIKSVRFTTQGSPLAGASDVGCIYESGVDLYYNDGNGNQIRITQSGSVAGSTGTITGLPSGTASAAYAAGTFTFQSATSTPANMSFGPVKISRNAASAKGVTIAANASQASDYSMTLPQALPGGAYYMTLDNTGAIAFNSSGYTGTGQVVLDAAPAIDSPIFSGTSTGTITSGTYTPTVTAGSNGTSQAGVAGSFVYTRSNDRVTVWGQVTGVTDVSTICSMNVTLPINPTSNFSHTYDLLGLVGVNGATFRSGFVTANTGAKTADVFFEMSASSQSVTSNINFTYSCA